MAAKLITFDVTNTLLKFRMSPGHMYAKVGSMYGVEAHPDHLTASFLQHWKSMNKELPNFGAARSSTSRPLDTSTSAAQDWWRTLVDSTFRSSGNPLDAKQLSLISTHLFQSYRTGACWEVRPGTQEVLTTLKKRDEPLRLGVISNFDYRLHDVLTDTGLVHFFDFVVASYDVGFYKPQTGIFDLALDRCNACGPKTRQHCISTQACHVGDDLDLDYRAARAAGWNALLLRQGDSSSLSGHDAAVHSHVIGDILEVLERTRNLTVAENLP